MTTNNSWNSSNPAQVARGGSGRATSVAYSVLCGGTTTTNPHQSVASVGTAGQVLTSNGAGALPTFQGIPLQVVTGSTSAVVACSTIIPNDDTIPQITEGDEVVTAAITPRSASSTLLLIGNVSGAPSGATTTAMAIFVDSTADAIAAVAVDNTAASINGTITASISAGSTSARTYRLRCGPSSAVTWYINATGAGVRKYGGVASSTLTVIEIG